MICTLEDSAAEIERALLVETVSFDDVNAVDDVAVEESTVDCG